MMIILVGEKSWDEVLPIFITFTEIGVLRIVLDFWRYLYIRYLTQGSK